MKQEMLKTITIACKPQSILKLPLLVTEPKTH